MSGGTAGFVHAKPCPPESRQWQARPPGGLRTWAFACGGEHVTARQSHNVPLLSAADLRQTAIYALIDQAQLIQLQRLPGFFPGPRDSFPRFVGLPLAVVALPIR